MPTGIYKHKKRENIWWGYLISAGKKAKHVHLSDEAKEKVRIGVKKAYDEGRVKDKTGYKWTTEQKAQLLGRIPWNKGKSFLKGNKHWNWQGGINPINDTIRKSLKYKSWREAVFKRDSYTCVICGLHSGNGKAVILHADHIKPFALFPKERFAINNGRTLCKDCHLKTDTYGTKIKRYFAISVS